MGGYCYDLHIHSCLSPCGDEEMTPNNLIHMAQVNGLDLVALTDHNTCGNCRAAAEVAKQAGIAFLPGMELTTREEIHVVCLFPDCERAEAFGAYVYERLPAIRNRPDIFGRQVYRDAQDNETGEEERLLLTATSIALEQVSGLTASYGGLCFPAHIDKDANSVLAILGSFPEDCGFTRFEVARPETFFARPDADAMAAGRRWLRNSDAHYLWDIAEAGPQLTGEDRDLLELAGLPWPK